ncbi:MAG: pilus assembly protein PilM [bacterium]
MRKLTDIAAFFRRDYSDVLGIDIGSSGTKLARLSQIHGVPTVIAIDVLPAIKLPESEESLPDICEIPKPVKARYAAVAISKGGGLVKLLTFPVHLGKSNDEHVRELMGLGENANYRLGYEVISETRTEVRALASAIPDETVRAICGTFSVGTPAPCSIEVSGLASMTAFSRAQGWRHADDCCAVIDFGASVTVVAFFNKKNLIMVRKFDFGMSNLVKKLQDSLGVDQDVAAGILNDGSFDVSKAVHQAMEPFLQQLIISWDFVERRESLHVGKLYVCGGAVGLPLWDQEIELATGKAPTLWDPFEGLVVQPGAIPERLKGQELRFSAAVGAAFAMLKAN